MKLKSESTSVVDRFLISLTTEFHPALVVLMVVFGFTGVAVTME